MSKRLEVSPAAADILASLGWKTLDDVFAAEGGHVFARSGTSSTVLLPVPGDDASSVFLKRYEYPRFAVHNVVRKSRPMREWRSLQTLARLGVPVPEPVAWGEQRRLRRLVRGCIVTRALQGSEDLETYMQERASPRRSVLVAFAHAVAHMHSQGFAHGDLYLRNVIVQDDGDEGLRFYFIDAPNGRLVSRRSGALVGDLANLDLDAARASSEGQRRLFLRHYLAPQTGRPDRVLERILTQRILRARLPLAHAAERKAARRARREKRKG